MASNKGTLAPESAGSQSVPSEVLDAHSQRELAGSWTEFEPGVSSSFMFATGIESSYPTAPPRRGGRRGVEGGASTRHYDRWKDDFALVRELGIGFLRYGPPYYKTHLGPGRYDWDFADETFRTLREMQ